MTVPQLTGASTESLTNSMLPPPHRTIIILDWDDTLLASTWLANNDLRLDNTHFMEDFHRAELKELEVRVERFLERAIGLGRVLLVTNAETGWVELSCERFMPGLAGFLNKVKVVSARSKYECHFPNQPNQWKIQAFREELYHLLDGSSELANVISIGDSHHEREALHVVTSELENTLVKSVKFVERPAMEVLRRQIELVHGCIEYITQHGGDLDLMLSQSLLFGTDDVNELIGQGEGNSEFVDEEDQQQLVVPATPLKQKTTTLPIPAMHTPHTPASVHSLPSESDVAAGGKKTPRTPTWEEMEAIATASGI